MDGAVFSDIKMYPVKSSSYKVNYVVVSQIKRSSDILGQHLCDHIFVGWVTLGY